MTVSVFDRYAQLEEAPGGDGWKVIRTVGDVSVEIFKLGGANPPPTKARLVTYGPRGGIRWIVGGDEIELERQRQMIDVASEAIYTFDVKMARES